MSQRQGADEAGIRDRLKRLLDGHSRAEIARKTGATAVNVGRYARGTRIPADFCASLVRSMGINATWLLVGEGISEIRDGGADPRRARELLGLIDSINAVSRLQIGALAGNEHGRVLRDLREALETRERLERKLGAESSEMLERLLNTLSERFTAGDFKGSADLCQLAGQVARLSADKNLRLRLWEFEARLEAIQHRPQQAVEILRRITHQFVVDGKMLTAESAALLNLHCFALANVGRNAEALRISDAAQAMAGPEVHDTQEWAAMQGARALYLMDGGRLRDAHATLNRVISRMGGFRRDYLRGLLQVALVLGGGMTIEDAIAAGPRIQSKAIWMVHLALVTERPKVLRLAAAHLAEVERETRREDSGWPARGRMFADLIEGKGPPKLAALAREMRNDIAEAPGNPSVEVGTEALVTLYARLAGKRTQAVAHMRETHRRVQATEIGNVQIWVQAIHARNALALVKHRRGGDATIRSWAEALLTQHDEAGYGLFREVSR
jgi:hypothetical protein